MTTDSSAVPLICFLVLLLVHAWCAQMDEVLTALHEKYPRVEEQEKEKFGRHLSQILMTPRPYLLSVRILRLFCALVCGGLAAFVFVPKLSGLFWAEQQMVSRLLAFMILELILIVI
ncbi:MAG: hypothetical protein IJ242_09590, partial [Clostridia bacterium]|nr:hypothetical protein [Clostridia bacterium]